MEASTTAASAPSPVEERFPWLFAERDPDAVMQSIAEDAHRALTATTLPRGYGPAPDRGKD
jgi:hypothetical protein